MGSDGDRIRGKTLWKIFGVIFAALALGFGQRAVLIKETAKNTAMMEMVVRQLDEKVDKTDIKYIVREEIDNYFTEDGG